MVKWAQNFEEPVLLDTWEIIWVRNVKFTQAQNLREKFYKMFYRWHLDPQKMSRMYPDLQPKCWRCGCLDATYYHIWWLCKNIKVFWIKIWWNIQRIFRRRIKFTPQLFLLGIVSDCDSKEIILMLNLITAARLLVGQCWKKESLPTLQEWFFKVSYLAEMAKISAFLKDQLQEKYLLVWKRWIDFIQYKLDIKKYYLVFE
ncbi:hypothetical protein NXF25_020386 [Crotalus adamanteus]|uniref:Reverse transcriptase zinc-binding domain-containing protein n=1 Tax=Crotalus adamanteus TaxID=8729 RepID=A0AAW1B4E0_CROAD